MIAAADSSRGSPVPAPKDSADRGWLHAEHPDAGELARLRAAGIPPSLLAHALDENELARVDHADGTTLIVLRVPYQGRAGDVPFRTTSLAVLVRGDLVITLSRRTSEVVTAVRRAVDPNIGAGKLIPRLVLEAADRFLLHLGEIEAQVERLEERLQISQRNEEVVHLLRCQKALIHFTTALASNSIMLEHLTHDTHAGHLDLDHDLMDDALVEIRQAISMTKIQTEILGEMMDAFASIISNNLNVVMKVLTVMTIVLTIPTMIASLYGMNVPLPAQRHPAAFAMLVGLCIVGALGAMMWFRRKRWV